MGTPRAPDSPADACLAADPHSLTREALTRVKAAILDEGAANAPTPYLASERVTVGAIFPQGHNRRQ
ncbi:hypothetical protein NDU88_005192 [Pleurodeles waltl]|uniref:Uncharacterized protein n=1 Tax=Pleurodeles waltl TaxID=8319 RepID=A0AAV7NLS9_PLEWA|nr:hypothetical protein NDU88_005192 [Pleurodeles waltl]